MVDNYSVPGLEVIQAGNYDAGYFSTVHRNSFITADRLVNELGFTKGTLLPDRVDSLSWFKMASEQRVVFVADRNILRNISWNELNDAGLIDGSAIVSVNSRRYRVRVLRGLKDGSPLGSEWNRLLLPMSHRAATKDWFIPENVESDLADWGLGFTDSELGFYPEITNESSIGHSIDEYSYNERGVDGSYSRKDSKTALIEVSGWRPVLELITDSPHISGENGYVGSRTRGFEYEFDIGKSEASIPLKELWVTLVVPGQANKTLATIVNPSEGRARIEVTDEMLDAIPMFTQFHINVLLTDQAAVFNYRVYTFSKGRVVPELPLDTPLLDVVQAVSEIPPYLEEVRESIRIAVDEKGGEVTEDTKLYEMGEAVMSIPTGSGGGDFIEFQATSEAGTKDFVSGTGSSVSSRFVKVNSAEIGFIPSMMLIYSPTPTGPATKRITTWLSDDFYYAGNSGFSNCESNGERFRIPWDVGASFDVPISVSGHEYIIRCYK